MSYCPKWVLKQHVPTLPLNFLAVKSTLTPSPSGYAAVLSSFYQTINNAVASVIEQMLRFLDDLNAGETAAPLAIGFCHNKIFYEQPNKPRKMKGLFGSADEPVKNLEHSADAAFKSFKAYVYALRNEVAELSAARLEAI